MPGEVSIQLTPEQVERIRKEAYLNPYDWFSYDNVKEAKYNGEPVTLSMARHRAMDALMNLNLSDNFWVTINKAGSLYDDYKQLKELIDLRNAFQRTMW